jgi:hypothetical protein
MEYDDAEGFNDNLKDFFDDIETEKIVEIPERFKIKLGLDERSYKYLNSAKNLKEFLEVLLAGSAGGLSGYLYGLNGITFFKSLLVVIGYTTKFSLLVGTVSAGGGVFLAGILIVKYLYNKADSLAMDRIPKFINTPIDILGASVLDILLYPAVKISLADGHFSYSEVRFIVDNIYNDWGISRDYCKKSIKNIFQTIHDYDYKITYDMVVSVCGDNKNINKHGLFEDICLLVEGISFADGDLSAAEQDELLAMRQAFLGNDQP